MTLELIPPVTDSCEVSVDPQNVQLPATLILSMVEGGDIYFGGYSLGETCRGKAEYERIKTAFDTRNYTLRILSNGRMQLETK
jgi:hypothetical protein